ncbi:MAG: hypothetical protein JW384_04366 [Nitrosomonadaceae bacterium]|nr:hypothetical protein [Nitrosomonadaceae bacterium]
MEHTAFVGMQSSRVRSIGRTLGWATKCSCGHFIRTNGNHPARHRAQVAKHIAEAVT